MQTITHEQFLANYFTHANSIALQTALNATCLQHAINVFEDTRSEEQVNAMLAKLQAANITKHNYVWIDELDAYTY